MAFHVPGEDANLVEVKWQAVLRFGKHGQILRHLLFSVLNLIEHEEGYDALQRIVAFFVLDQVQDGEKKVPQYLTVLTEPKDGLPFDFNQIRVFTWNVKRHRYETAYRERIQGVLPVAVSQENFEKEGTLPVFMI